MLYYSFKLNELRLGVNHSRTRNEISYRPVKEMKNVLTDEKNEKYFLDLIDD